MGRGSWSDVLWRFCGSRFVGLSSWVWVCGFELMGLGLWVWARGSGFMGLGSWIIDLINLIGVGHQLDQRGSLIVVVVVEIVVACGRRWV